MASARPAGWSTRHIQLRTGAPRALGEWPPTGPRVVFLPATRFSRGCWRPHTARWAPSATPILVDLPGHGALSKPPDPSRWLYCVEDIVCLHEAEDWQDVVLGGHSVGGATAVRVAARLPHRLHGLVLLESIVPAPPTVVRATDSRGMPSPCGPSVAKRISLARELVVHGSGQFLPLEDVEVVVGVVAGALSSQGNA